MDVFINDQKHSVNEQTTVAEMMKYMEVKSNKGLAVAVNETIVPRDDWQTTNLKDGDKVLMIRATSGG
jgi:sulfur carrier protein